MSVHLTEEEQLEMLKRWWRDYGKIVLAVIVLAVGGYFGFTNWQANKKAQAEAASVLYTNLIQVASPASGQALTDESRTTAKTLAQQLKDGRRTSLYAHNAALLLARLAVEEGNLDQAVAELRWVLANKPDLATEQITRLRLARVLISQANYTDAETLLTNPVDAFKAEYAEARGDLARARGDLDAARTAYQQALADTDAQQQERSMLLQLKLDDLKSSSAVASLESAE